MSAHTPGPWHARNSPSEIWGEVRDAEGLWVARVHQRYGDDSSNPECESNTSLIAAAPEMLKALKALAGLCDCAAYELDATQCEHARARAAIAKAEGSR